MFGYKMPAPNEAMLVSGGKVKGEAAAPFRVVTGHGAFVPPWFRKARFLTLSLQEAEVTEPCVTGQGIALTVRAVIAFKVGPDQESIVNAGQRFLDNQDQMPTLTGRIFAGHLRSIVGAMTVEEIVTQRQKLATEVLDGSKTEMATLGLVVDSFQIQGIDDRTGYIDSMAAPHRAAIEQAAKIAQAQAAAAAAEAEQESARDQAGYTQQTAVFQAQANAKVNEAQQAADRAQAEYERQTAVVRAQAKADVDKAQATASQAGPLAAAQAQAEVTAAQAALAGQQAALREKQLVAEVVKPAEADAQRTRVLADAEAAKVTVLAEAAASHGRVELDRLLIGQLPEIVRATASGLSGAHITVLNGSQGMGEITAGLVSQALAVWETIRAGTGQAGNGAPSGH